MPTEAQWESACRAGTETALYSGPAEIIGDANAQALDAIVWYGGNSNLGFDLDNSQVRSWLQDMHYPGGKAETHPVKGKRPNPWGLYDMLCTTATRARLWMGRPGIRTTPARSGCSATGLGPTTRATAAARPAIGSRLSTATTTWACGAPKLGTSEPGQAVGTRNKGQG